MNLSPAAQRALTRLAHAAGWVRAARGQGNAYHVLLRLGLAERRVRHQVRVEEQRPGGRPRPVVEFRMLRGEIS